jgi:hypothetical protein
MSDEGQAPLCGLAPCCNAGRGLPPEGWGRCAARPGGSFRLLTRTPVLRSRYVTPRTLIANNSWGIRMRWVAREQEAAAFFSAETGGTVKNRDTTPHMRTYRTGAMKVSIRS